MNYIEAAQNAKCNYLYTHLPPSHSLPNNKYIHTYIHIPIPSFIHTHAYFHCNIVIYTQRSWGAATKRVELKKRLYPLRQSPEALNQVWSVPVRVHAGHISLYTYIHTYSTYIHSFIHTHINTYTYPVYKRRAPLQSSQSKVLYLFLFPTLLLYLSYFIPFYIYIIYISMYMWITLGISLLPFGYTYIHIYIAKSKGLFLYLLPDHFFHLTRFFFFFF